MTDTKILPDPGSDPAIEAGCTCPIVRNNFGEGNYIEGIGFQFICSSDCPIHTRAIFDPTYSPNTANKTGKVLEFKIMK
jgi:hypothetical protein